jgi:hypothetical protein
LDQICKTYKRNKKTEKKKKEEKEKKYRKGPQANLSARQQIEPMACLKTRNGIPNSPLPSLTCGPHMSGHIITPNLQPDFSPGSSPEPRDPILFILVKTLPNSTHLRAYKGRPNLLSLLRPFSLSLDRQAAWNRAQDHIDTAALR